MGFSSISLRTNVSSLNAQKNITKTERSLTTSMTRLSSGLRINQAADDAAGLAISSKLRAQVRGLGQAQRNANDGISMLQTAEGALNEIDDMLTRMREISVQSANGTLGANERISLNTEFSALRSEIDRIANVTQFNGLSLIQGSQSAGITFQVGAGTDSNNQIKISIASAKAADISVGSALTISTAAGALSTITKIDTAIGAVSTRRGKIGAAQNRLYTTINNLQAMHENLSAANSRITDTDVAEESANFSKSQILMQAGVSMLAQANQLPSLALSLIG